VDDTTRRQEALVTRPDQSAPRIIDHLGMRLEEFLLEDCQAGIIQVELEFQCVIDDSPAVAKQD
jgi:hypothetical protein